MVLPTFFGIDLGGAFPSFPAFPLQCCTGLPTRWGALAFKHCSASDLGPKFNLWNTKAYDIPSASGLSENNGSLPFTLRE